MDFLRLIRLGGTDAAVVYIALVAACMVFLVNASFNWGQAEDFLMIDWYRRVVLTGEWGAIDILSVKNEPHPLAFQVALVVGFYSLAGPGFTSVVVLSGVIVAATALAAYVTVADDLPTRGQKLLALCALVVLFFHPAQTNHLLWAFEVGWFAIPLFLVLALLALQRAKGVGPYLAVLFCLLASFSSGHGAFTWLAVAVLLALQRRLLWAWVFVVGFLAFSAAFFLGLDSSQNRATDAIGNPFAVLPKLGVYVIQLFGFISGGRTPEVVLIAGMIGLALVFAVVVVRWKEVASREASAVAQLAIVFSVYSAAATVSFALARHKFGIEWAIDRLHAAPLVIPLFAGAAVLAIGGARKGVLRLAVCVLLFTFVGYSLAASVSYAVTRSQEAQVARALGMKTSCSGSDPELARRLNSLAAHNPANMLVETNWKVLQPLCTNRIPARAVATMALPEEFQRRIKLEPESEKALRDLWKVYTYRFDLQRAFPVTDTATPIKLLDFAKHNARSGTKYESDALRPHEAYFASLP